MRSGLDNLSRPSLILEIGGEHERAAYTRVEQGAGHWRTTVYTNLTFCLYPYQGYVVVYTNAHLPLYTYTQYPKDGSAL